RGEVTPNRDARLLAKVLARDRPRGDAHCGFACRCAPAAAVVPNPVFLVVRVIGVAGAITVLDLLVVAPALVHVLDQQTDRGARRPALEDAGKDPDAIRLLALGHEARLPRTAA